jgi:hypothetical protein
MIGVGARASQPAAIFSQVCFEKAFAISATTDLKARRAAAQLLEITACLKSPAGVNMSCLFGVTAMRWDVAGGALSLLKVSPEGSP